MIGRYPEIPAGCDDGMEDDEQSSAGGFEKKSRAGRDDGLFSLVSGRACDGTYLWGAASEFRWDGR